jgi:protein tyrosine phosphatase
MAAERKYKLTSMGVMKWAEHELKHVGRIVAVEDPDIQYSYAMSTLYGMLHLKKALTEMVNDSAYSVQREDLQRTLDQVVRAIKHLIKDFSLDLNAIQTFNTKKILGDLANVRPAPVASIPPVNVNAQRLANNAKKAANNATRKAANNAARKLANNAARRAANNATRKKGGFLGFLGL